MRILLVLYIVFQASLLFGQSDLFINNRDDDPRTFNEDLAPFFHGVASGDPLEDRVIIWTRVTPSIIGPNVDVEWQMATDTEMENVVASGTVNTSPSRDYTVKVDVTGLDPGRTYYYVFKYEDDYSLIGKTKTVPNGNIDHLRFAVVSCSNYQAGYFNAYQRIADRNDLDALIHLGDYIYEYRDSQVGDSDLFDERPILPEEEPISLDQYRIRYSTYRLDQQLINVHQQHPIIAVWDDHEAANNAYKDGAGNHDAGEGSWGDRVDNIKKAYFEWMPIRDQADNRVYRKIAYGNLLDLIMMDTRLEGRDVQIGDIESPALQSATRTILGAEQRQWLFTQLVSSDAKWKVLGNQVIFAEFNIGFASEFGFGQTYASVENSNLDIWDGYPAERDRVLDLIKDNEIDNVVVITGDSHASFAFDLSKRPSAYPEFAGVSNDAQDYDEQTQEGSLAVEFAAPSISSHNFDENWNPILAAGLEFQINKPVATSGLNPNPHLRFVDLDRHGYVLLDVTNERVQADYFYSGITALSSTESFGHASFTADQDNKLTENPNPSQEKIQQDTPAPPGRFRNSTATVLKNNFDLVGIHPTPAKDQVSIQIALEQRLPLEIAIYNIDRRLVKKLPVNTIDAGIYTQQIDLSQLPSGNYKVIFRAEGQVVGTGTILVAK